MEIEWKEEWRGKEGGKEERKKGKNERWDRKNNNK